MSIAEQETVNPYNESHSEQRQGLIVKSPWHSGYQDYIEKHAIKALYFNSVKGWKESDFAFLSSLNGIEEINIIMSTVENLSSIENLTSLQQLSVTAAVKETVDFSILSKLERCYLYWWKGAESIFNAPALITVYLDKLKLKHWHDLAQLARVQQLTLANTPMPSLDWLDAFVGSPIEELHLLNCRKITDFAPISRLTQLKRLSISGSKALYDLDFLSPLKKLEVLDVSDSDSLKSLSPLSELRALKAFSFAGSKTTVENKDLSPLTQLPNLSMLMFGPRKGYSHKLIKQWNWENFEKPDKLLTST